MDEALIEYKHSIDMMLYYYNDIQWAIEQEDFEYAKTLQQWAADWYKQACKARAIWHFERDWLK